MNLLDLPLGARARVTGIEGGDRLRAKLTQHGLFPGDRLVLLRRAPLRGPLLVSINGREIALGRGVAEKILVEPDECASL